MAQQLLQKSQSQSSCGPAPQGCPSQPQFLHLDPGCSLSHQVNRTGYFFRKGPLCFVTRVSGFSCWRNSSPGFYDAVLIPLLRDRFLLEADIAFIRHYRVNFSARAHGGFGEHQLSLQQHPQPPLLLATAFPGRSPCK